MDKTQNAFSIPKVNEKLGERVIVTERKSTLIPLEEKINKYANYVHMYNTLLNPYEGGGIGV